jgi:multidrug efflux system membrane fusion protein
MSRRFWTHAPGSAWILILAGSLCIGGCTIHPAAAAGTAANPAIPVTTAHARAMTVTRTIDALGTVTPLQDVAITVRVDGLLEAVPAVEGEEVAQEAVLAQLDQRPYAALCSQQEAVVARDRAQLVQAQADLGRAQTLAAGGMLARSALDQARAQADALAASLAADQAGLQAARLNLSFTTVRAPFAGMVSLRRVDPGAVVHATDAGGILSLTQLDPISVIVPVGQDDLDALRTAAARHEWRASLRSRAGEPLAEATLQAIDTHVDPASGEVRCRLLARNPAHHLWPGAFVIASLPLDEESGVAVPTAAVERTQDGWTLWDVDAGRLAQLCEVQTGLSAKGWTIIHAGVSSGSEVVTGGQARLVPGAAVDAQPDAAAASGTTAAIARP